jgi:inosine-uridine nucleoside N-ribohydrolase
MSVPVILDCDTGTDDRFLDLLCAALAAGPSIG